MLSVENRDQIAGALGNAIDELVADLYSEIVDGVSAVQEAEITSRLCQRLEDRLDNREVGDDYKFRVIAQSLPDRGPNSMERLLGADLFLSVSLEGKGGFDKGVFVQAKYDRNIKRREIQDAASRMRGVAGKIGSYVWIYEPSGVKVISAHEADRMTSNTIDGLPSRTMKGFAGRILDCYAGSRRWGISPVGDRRQAVADRLREARAKNVVDINIKKQRP
ncbi:hypothetical protein ACCS54_07255 [Rhizobium johnstonii]|uniref:hypothetical protein n=1 Tax=Rhizobium johnstonii TaxID=3019933 RepID=UPI003F9BF1B6